MASTGTSCNTCDSGSRRTPYMGMTGGAYYDDDEYGQDNRFMGSSAGGQGYNDGMYGESSNDQYGYDTYQFDDDYSDMQFANNGQKMSMDELRQFRREVAQSEPRDAAGRWSGGRNQGLMQFQSGDEPGVIIDKNGRRHDSAGRFLPENGMNFRSNSSQRRSGANRRSGDSNLNYNNGSYGGSSGGGYNTGSYTSGGSGSGSFGGNTGNGGTMRFRSGGNNNSRYRSGGNNGYSNKSRSSRSNY